MPFPIVLTAEKTQILLSHHTLVQLQHQEAVAEQLQSYALVMIWGQLGPPQGPSFPPWTRILLPQDPCKSQDLVLAGTKCMWMEVLQRQRLQGLGSLLSKLGVGCARPAEGRFVNGFFLPPHLPCSRPAPSVRHCSFPDKFSFFAAIKMKYFSQFFIRHSLETFSTNFF